MFLNITIRDARSESWSRSCFGVESESKSRKSVRLRLRNLILNFSYLYIFFNFNYKKKYFFYNILYFIIYINEFVNGVGVGPWIIDGVGVGIV